MGICLSTGYTGVCLIRGPISVFDDFDAVVFWELACDLRRRRRQSADTSRQVSRDWSESLCGRPSPRGNLSTLVLNLVFG